MDKAGIIHEIEEVVKRLQELRERLRRHGPVDEIETSLHSLYSQALGLSSSAMAQCFEQLSELLYKQRYPAGSEDLQISYGWAMSEALFYSLAANMRHDKSLLADYGLYASATVLALENLFRRCEKKGTIAIVFIATAQTPAELVYGEHDLSDTSTSANRFTNMNKQYKLRSRNAIRKYLHNQQNLIIERHVFARRKPITELTTDGKSQTRLNKFLQEVDPARITFEYDEPGEFSRWIGNNHACRLSKLSSPEKMARIQWFEEPASYRGLDWNANAICTDLIVFGSSAITEVPEYSAPPTLDRLDIRWEFGLQSIDLGAAAEGRVVQPLHGPHLNDEEQVNFLGFKEYGINDFIKCLQGVQVGDNKLGLKKSGYIIEEQPWKQMWEESKRLDTLAHRLRPISESSPFRYEIFISYSHSQAADIAQGVFEKLKDEGFQEKEIFLDKKDLSVGSSLNELADAIRGSRAFVILFNRDWQQRWQNQELHQFYELRNKNRKEIRVIPVYLEEVEVCPLFNDLNAIRYKSSEDTTNVCAEIAREIKKSLSQ